MKNGVETDHTYNGAAEGSLAWLMATPERTDECNSNPARHPEKTPDVWREWTETVHVAIDADMSADVINTPCCRRHTR